MLETRGGVNQLLTMSFKMKGYVGATGTSGLYATTRIPRKANKKSLNPKGKNKVKGKGKDKKDYIPKPIAIERPAKDDACHHCKEVGHWKRNCHVYLAELQKKRKQVGSASSSIERKLKQVASFACNGPVRSPLGLQKGYTTTLLGYMKKTFSPVADIRAIRILISITAYYDYEIWQMDVKTAFLNGYLDEDIYMVQPEGFVDPNHPRKVCKLQRSIYGLKQASRSWNKRFDEEIESGLEELQASDHCISATESEYIAACISCHGKLSTCNKLGDQKGAIQLSKDDIIMFASSVETGRKRILKGHKHENLAELFYKGLINRKLYSTCQGLRPASSFNEDHRWVSIEEESQSLSSKAIKDVYGQFAYKWVYAEVRAKEELIEKVCVFRYELLKSVKDKDEDSVEKLLEVEGWNLFKIYSDEAAMLELFELLEPSPNLAINVIYDSVEPSPNC
ncbi:retrotransposon protein, putative, ty1-copia subclass [Tanacetum coccineum]|uniref:Retrotransposon protein, putative, ty1-copia subclass n=1 Tax=Tanacetum coccineum TaxID=301880 RepID=A0ABQ5BGU6_9ASTR